ncbi:MAG: glycosyltransferase family 39 protein [Chloroflexi bacterium]|nr:glycosyltransferase family 39 protein [Chloroflexota bacterium]
MQTVETGVARGASARSGQAAFRTAWSTVAAVIVLCGIALAPRAFGLADFLTTDEAYHWITRTERFSAAITERRWADTALTGHPGVTNMWLGSLGLAIERAATGAGIAPPATRVQHLAWLRLPGALMQVVLILAAYPLLRRLVGPAVAWVATLLWATSPYLIAHGRLLHLDALLTGFVTLSLLMLLASLQQQERREHGGWPLLLGSGLFAGLALLTKGPALILLPFAGLLLFVLTPPIARSDQGKASPASIMVEMSRRGRYAVTRYASWLAMALLLVLLAWPALWVTPAAALGRYVEEILTNGGRPNGDGQFFNGQAVGDPGVWFYPVVSLFRTTPVMLAGLAAFTGFAVAAAWRAVTRRTMQISTHNRILLALLVFVLFWMLVMTLGPKKFDRYVLPTWPSLSVLAAAGLVRGLDAARTWAGRYQASMRRGAVVARRAPLAAFLVLGGLELGQIAWYHPYYLSYYNPLLGGGPVAQRMFLIGWGEGMDQVGAWISSRQDIGYGPVISALGPTLQPFVPVDVRDVDDLGRLPINYAVAYLESLQRGANPAIYRQMAETVPVHTVTIHGIEYARIYQIPRPYDQAVGARFGDALLLRGVTITREQGRLVLTPAWDVRARPGRDYLVFVHLLDDQGRQMARIDVAPGGAGPPTSTWEAGRQVAVPLPLDIPPDLAPGAYHLVMGVYDATGGNRLPFSGGTPADPALAGEHAVLITVLALP